MPVDKRYISLEFSEDAFRERNRDLALILDIGSLLQEAEGLKDFLDKCVVKVAGHFGLSAGRIYLMEAHGEWLHLAASTGVEISRLEKVRVGKGFSGRSASTRSFIAQHVSDLEDRERAQMLAAKGLKIVICVPLIALGKVIGVMNLAGERFIGLSQPVVDLLTAIGNQMALAVSNLRLLEEVRFFTYSFMHDLKGPALAVHGLARRLQDRHGTGLDEKGRLCCEQIVKASGQLHVLIEHLNEYIHAREAPLKPEESRLDELARDIRGEFAERLSAQQVKLITSEAVGSVTADRLSLLRAIRNLVDNALKYGGQGLSEIEIAFRREGGLGVVTVSDDGVGLRPEAMDDLFKIFYRHDTSKGTQGSGLGLAIVKEIAERHGGHAWAEQGKRGKGIAFSFSIADPQPGALPQADAGASTSRA